MSTFTFNHMNNKRLGYNMLLLTAANDHMKRTIK